jgi:hypothetical protein
MNMSVTQFAVAPAMVGRNRSVWREIIVAPAVPAAPQEAGGCRHRREQWRSAGQHCASPAPPRYRTPPDEPATRSPASYADAPVARGRDAAAPLPVALPSSLAQIASSGAQQPRKSLRHQRHRAYLCHYLTHLVRPGLRIPQGAKAKPRSRGALLLEGCDWRLPPESAVAPARSVPVAGCIAVIVIRSPRASVPVAYVAHALTQTEVTRCGREVVRGHRRCRRGHDSAQRNTGH